MGKRTSIGLAVVVAILPAILCQALASAPVEEVFDFRVNWRLWHAGDIRLTYKPPPPNSDQPWQGEVSLQTQGFVDSLYHVDNVYTVLFDESQCALSSIFQVSEGSKRRHVSVTYQSPPGMASYLERDLVKDEVALQKVVPIPPCTMDELSALARIRSSGAKPGDVLELPVSNGKKSVLARVEVQQRETVKTRAGVFPAIRYEAFLFNNVLYRRKGRLLFWLTDDERRLPVKIRLNLAIYFGTISIELESKEP